MEKVSDSKSFSGMLRVMTQDQTSSDRVAELRTRADGRVVVVSWVEEEFARAIR